MCALFGWLDYKGVVPYRVLEKLTQALANAAEEGGTDAAGISYVKDGRVIVFKRPEPAHKIHFNVPDGTKAVMGHDRLATQGNKKNNCNNHPFEGYADREFALAHNGSLWNDKELRKNGTIPDSHIDTDSYIGVQLIEKQGKLDSGSLQYMADTVDGIFTFSVLDQSDNLYIIKGSNPMYLVKFEELGLYVYASTESIMTKAINQLGLNESEYKCIDTEDGDILCIDIDGSITRSHFEPKMSKYLRNAEQGSDDAQYKLGFMYQNGYGVEQNDEEAVRWYRRAAEQDNAEAQFNLGVMYQNGNGVEQNDEEAFRWYRRAAERGSANGQCNLGWMYENGKGVEQNKNTAVKWYRKAAEHGNVDAQFNLGVMYENGYGVEQNPNTAAEWYKKAAEHENAAAQFNLGVMYENGYGVEQNRNTAAEWYKKAAEQENAVAQCYLAYMYETGYVLSKDSSQAIKWYRRSAAQGNEVAKNNLEKLGVSMDETLLNSV